LTQKENPSFFRGGAVKSSTYFKTKSKDSTPSISLLFTTNRVLSGVEIMIL
jgi:hypothetical protein